MPRPRFPQFEDGEKAAKETASRLNRAAKSKAHIAETIARERDALERSRILLKLPQDPFEIARQVAVAAPIRGKSPSAKKKLKKGR